MIMEWLRTNKYAAAALTLLRLYVGWAWLTAGWHKVSGAEAFDASGFMQGAVDKPLVDRATQEILYPTFTSFLENIALPNVGTFSFLVAWGELFIGVGLILGALTTTAMFFGLMMNFMFMFAGSVSTNPWLLLLGFIILAAGANAGRFGADHYILPYIHTGFKKVQGPKTPKIKPAGSMQG